MIMASKFRMHGINKWIGLCRSHCYDSAGLTRVLCKRSLVTDTGATDTLKVSISENTINEFHQNGVVCIRGAFNKSWTELAHTGIEKCFANPSDYADVLPGDGGDGIYFNDYLNWDKVEEIETYVRNSPAAELAGLLMQSSMALFFHEHVFVKKRAKGRAAPWHHDQAYYPVNGMQNCTVWMPTTPVSKETSLKFVKGSHLWGKCFHPKKFASALNYQTEQTAVEMEYEQVPEIDENKHDVQSFDLEPGDCVVFHMKTLHATNASSADIPRYVLATRWLGEDAVFAARPWQVSPPLELLPKDIQIGDKFCERNDEKFPILWKRLKQ